MATYLGAPSRSSIAIFAGPVAQERIALGASFADEANRITQEAYNSIPGAGASQGDWGLDWNAIGKAAQNFVGGLNAFLQGQQQVPTSQTNVGTGTPGPVAGQVPYQQPYVTLQSGATAPAASTIPPWAIAAAVAVAVALGWVLLGKGGRRRR